ncbi:MAG: hypothetical protein WC969_09575 [Elusimicrobiota bacterium]
MKGQVVYMYAYDVAYEIDLPKVRELITQRAQFLEVRPDKTIPRDVPFHRPLVLAEHPIIVQTARGPMTLHREAKLYSIGAVSISIRADFEVPALKDLLPYHDLKLEGERSIDDVAGGFAEQVLDSIRPHLLRPSPTKGNPEAYTVFCLYSLELGTSKDAQEWLRANRREAAGLLTEESHFEGLSEAEVMETVCHTHSYTTKDLFVVDWNSALIIDPDGQPDDLLYPVETANVQLTEFRVYDRILEESVDRAYDDLEEYTRKNPLMRAPGDILQRLRSMRIDLEKMSDEVSNITKFFGDWHLARVYMSCAERFHIKDWQASVESKLRTLDSLYNIVISDINNRRMLVLEAAIVGLFVADLILIYLTAK